MLSVTIDNGSISATSDYDAMIAAGVDANMVMAQLVTDCTACFYALLREISLVALPPGCENEQVVEMSANFFDVISEMFKEDDHKDYLEFLGTYAAGEEYKLMFASFLDVLQQNEVQFEDLQAMFNGLDLDLEVSANDAGGVDVCVNGGVDKDNPVTSLTLCSMTAEEMEDEDFKTRKLIAAAYAAVILGDTLRGEANPFRTEEYSYPDLGIMERVEKLFA